jgi:hypothetical protein
MINLDHYSLSEQERETIQALLTKTGNEPRLEDLYRMMDEVWQACGCDSSKYDEQRYATFYRHPIWLLNGIFIEQHEESLGHRRAIADAVHQRKASRVLDFGGGFGTLARMIAGSDPNCRVDIWDPFPPTHGIKACEPYANIRFVSSPEEDTYDALVCTDVLEHVHDPLTLLADIIRKVQKGGTLVIYNCFYGMIQCHLPCTFHFLYTFDDFCELMGLRVLGKTTDDHATIYSKVSAISPDWPLIRSREKSSKLSYAMNQWAKANPNAGSLRYKLALMRADPFYYLSKLTGKI